MNAPYAPVPSEESVAAWRAGLRGLRCLRLEFVHRTLDPVCWPAYKGGMWRGALGRALEGQPAALARMFAAGAGPGARHAALVWALRPPTIRDEWLPAGMALAWGVTLHGPAVELADACVLAARRLGVDVPVFGPLGSQRMELLHAAVRTVAGTTPLGSPGAITDLADVFEEGLAERHPGATGLSLLMRTPLELRMLRPGSQRPVPVRDPPAVGLLLRSLSHTIRLAREQQRLHLGPQRWPLPLSCDGEPVAGTAVRHCEPGYHGSPRRLEAIEGRCEYGARALPSLAWLRVAEWVQIGRSRHYGHGLVDAAVAPIRSPKPARSDIARPGRPGRWQQIDS